MHILLIEPFYSGSHKQFSDQLVKYSTHSISLMTMSGKFWKWRMYGAAVTLAEQFNQLKQMPDIILVSDMLDLSVFISLTRRKLKNIPIVTYFHENQFFYPWQKNSEDIKEKRDVHYGMINYQSALSADFNLFNSHHNMDSFFEGLTYTLKRMPDYPHDMSFLKEKSKVIPLGLELYKYQESHNLSNKYSSLIDANKPTILWNHRLEHDKNPGPFFQALLKLKDEKIPFQLLLLGEQSKSHLKQYRDYLDALSDYICFQGFLSGSDYYEMLRLADILPVTSLHDTFGISVAEAIHGGVTPLLPRRLSYIELYKPSDHPEIFYDTYDEMYTKLRYACMNHVGVVKKFEDNNTKLFKSNHKKDYTYLTSSFDWTNIIKLFDDFFTHFVKDITKA